MANQDWKKPLIDSIVQLRCGYGDQFLELGGRDLIEERTSGSRGVVFTVITYCGSTVKIDGDLIFSQEMKLKEDEFFRKNKYASMLCSVFKMIDDNVPLSHIKHMREDFIEELCKDLKK